MNCTICAREDVSEVDSLLGSGLSLRQLSRITGISRSTLSRHSGHARPASEPPEGGEIDPLEAAVSLLRRAQTERQKLRAAEAVRSATALRIRALCGVTDPAVLERLKVNLEEAAALYKAAEGSFENELRALSGHRQAVRAMIDAALGPETIEVPGFSVGLATLDGVPHLLPSDLPPRAMKVSVAAYYSDVPPRYHDQIRYTVRRTTHLSLTEHTKRGDTIYVFDANDDLVWWNEPEPPPGYVLDEPSGELRWIGEAP